MSTHDEFDNGWDTSATLVDGRWVDRTPRRPENEPQVRREAAVMPWLAPQLPLPVATPHLVSEDPLTVRHELIVGEACPGTSPRHGQVVGSFLVALHGVDPVEAVGKGALDADASYAAAQTIRDRMSSEVIQLLPDHLTRAGSALLERMATRPPDCRVVHGDLGPQHIRVVGEEVSGVIDWGDSCVGDPALDLSWTLFGSSRAFAEALGAAYRPTEQLVERAHDWHLLGPWHEVLYGLDTEQPVFVASGLSGVVARLEQFAHRARRNP